MAHPLAVPTDNLITLSSDELREAAAVFDAYRAAGSTAVAAIAHAVRAVNVMRTPAPAADCIDCRRPDDTCPGHYCRREVSL